MGGAFFHGPLLHGLSDLIGGGEVQGRPLRYALLPGAVRRRGETLLHSAFVKYQTPKQLRQFSSSHTSHKTSCLKFVLYQKGMRRAFSHSALTVVGEDPGGGIVHVAALPGPVGHPEVPKHPVPAGMVLPEDLPVQQAHLGKGWTTAALPPQRLKVKIRPAEEGQQLFLGTDLLKKPWPRTWAEAPPG